MLAPSKPTKFQQQMATNIEDLAKQFQGFQSMMKKALDELSSLNSWKGAVDESMGDLLLKTDAASACLLRLEHAPPPPPPQTGLSVQTDLDQPVRPSASSSGAAAGHNSSALHCEEVMEFSGLHRIRSQVRHMILLRVLLMGPV